MTRLPVSVCIIAKNEEENIESCLKCISWYGFEVVVTDTGSQDRTKEIARRYTDKVFDFAWTENFSEARNFCAEQAANDWIFVLDCDEQLRKLDESELKRMLDRFPQSVGMLRVKNMTCDEDGTQGYVTDDVMRLYHRKRYKFVSPVHEQLQPIGASAQRDKAACFCIPAEVLHYGYALPQEQMMEKQRRNLSLLYRYMDEEPGNAYIYFQIGQSEAILGNDDKAIEAYEKGISVNDNTELLFVQLMIISLSRIYRRAGRQKEAVALMQRYADKIRSAKYTVAYAETLWDDGSRMKAVVLYMKATMLPDSDTLGDEMLRCYAHIIQWYVDTGDEKMADLYKEKFAAYRKSQKRLIEGGEKQW